MARQATEREGVGPRSLATRLALPLSSALLFAAAFPNPLLHGGLWPLGPFVLLPFFLSLRKASPAEASLYGSVFALLSYALFNYWAFGFHPLAAPVILSVHVLWLALLSPLLARILNGKSPLRWVSAAALWTAYEWLKSSGWAGYPYGDLGSSMASFLPLSRSAALWGVWGISFLLAAVSAWISLALPELSGRFGGGTRAARAGSPRGLPPSLAIQGAVLFGALLLLCAAQALFPGLWNLGAAPQAGAKPLRVLVIQPDFPARKEGPLPASRSADALLSLVKRGLSASSGVRLIAMPETAFPPSIEIRLDFPPEEESDYAARRLLSGLGETGLPAILGNDKADYGLLPDGSKGRLHYNAALFMESGRVLSSYSKRRLVPFVEAVPSPPFPPALWRFAEDSWGPLWSPGSDLVLFTVDGLRIGTPICYEDCFGSDCRAFALAGADIIMCLASDAWSHSAAAQYQHLQSASLRAMETGRPLLRVTDDGVSALVLPDGKRSVLIPSGSEGFAAVDLPPPPSGKTPYLLLGDAFPPLCVAFLSLMALASLLKKRKASCR